MVGIFVINVLLAALLASAVNVLLAIAFFVINIAVAFIVSSTANHVHDLSNENIEKVEDWVYGKLARLYPRDERDGLVREWKSHVAQICAQSKPASRRQAMYLQVGTTLLSTLATAGRSIPRAARLAVYEQLRGPGLRCIELVASAAFYVVFIWPWILMRGVLYVLLPMMIAVGYAGHAVGVLPMRTTPTE